MLTSPSTPPPPHPSTREGSQQQCGTSSVPAWHLYERVIHLNDSIKPLVIKHNSTGVAGNNRAGSSLISNPSPPPLAGEWMGHKRFLVPVIVVHVIRKTPNAKSERSMYKKTAAKQTYIHAQEICQSKLQLPYIQKKYRKKSRYCITSIDNMHFS